MKPTGQRHHLHNEHQLNAFCETIHMMWQAGRKPTVAFLGDDRTTSQNALWNSLYGTIAAQSDDKSTLDVRRECKLYYGIPILRASNPEFCDWYDKSIKPMNLEDKLLLMTYMDVTSLFTKDQGTEYINTIITEYIKQGFQLERQEMPDLQD